MCARRDSAGGRAGYPRPHALIPAAVSQHHAAPGPSVPVCAYPPGASGPRSRAAGPAARPARPPADRRGPRTAPRTAASRPRRDRTAGPGRRRTARRCACGRLLDDDHRWLPPAPQPSPPAARPERRMPASWHARPPRRARTRHYHSMTVRKRPVWPARPDFPGRCQAQQPSWCSSWLAWLRPRPRGQPPGLPAPGSCPRGRRGSAVNGGPIGPSFSGGAVCRRKKMRSTIDGGGASPHNQRAQPGQQS